MRRTFKALCVSILALCTAAIPLATAGDPSTRPIEVLFAGQNVVGWETGSRPHWPNGMTIEPELIVVGTPTTVPSGDRRFNRVYRMKVEQVLSGDAVAGADVQFVRRDLEPVNPSPQVVRLRDTGISQETPYDDVEAVPANPVEIKAVRAYLAATLDMLVQPSDRIFIAKDDEAATNSVELIKPLMGKLPAVGARVDLMASYHRRQHAFFEEKQSEWIYFLSDPKGPTAAADPAARSVVLGRWPARDEADVVDAIKHKGVFPVADDFDQWGKPCRLVTISFRGSVVDAIDISSSAFDPQLGLESLVARPAESLSPVLAAIDADLLLDKTSTYGKFRRLHRLIDAVGRFKTQKSHEELCIRIDLWIDHLATNPVLSTAPARPGPGGPNAEIGRDDVNHSLAWLIATLNEQEVSERFGDRLLHLREITTGQCRAEVELAIGWARIDFNRELSAALDLSVKIKPFHTDVAVGRNTRDEVWHFNEIRSECSFSSDGRSFVVVGPDREIRRWNVADPKSFVQLPLPAGTYARQVFGPPAHLILCPDATTRPVPLQSSTVDADTGTVVASFPLKTKDDFLYAEFVDIGNGRAMCLEGRENQFIVDLKTGRVSDPPLVPFAWRDFFRDAVVDPVGRNKMLFADFKTKAVEISSLDLDTGKVSKLGALDSPVSDQAVFGVVPDGRHYYIRDQGVTLFDRKTLKRTAAIPKVPESDVLSFSADGGRFAILCGREDYFFRGMAAGNNRWNRGGDRVIRVYDTATGRMTFAATAKSPKLLNDDLKLSPDGKSLVFLNNDGSALHLDLWRLPD